MEMLPDGRPRFRQLLVLVARQNGKTELLVVLSLFWLTVQMVPLVLGTSTKLDYAQESWLKAIRLAKSHPELKALIPAQGGIRKTNGEQTLTMVDPDDPDGVESPFACRYKIAASNDEGGRSLSVDRLIEDELRQHFDWSAHEAAENAMNARPDAQAWAISNAGEERSVVLNSLRTAALAHMQRGGGDDRLGLFEWSAPEGADVTDLDALAQANPNLGHRIDPDALLGKATRAKEAGGEQEAKFRTEVMCQSVKTMTPAPITVKDWAARADPAGQWDGPFALSFEVSLGSKSAAVAVAGRRPDGKAQVEVLRHRPGTNWVVDFVATAAGQHGGAAKVVANDYGTNRALFADLRAAGVDVTPLGAPDFAASCAWLERAVNEDEVAHLGGDDDHEDLVATALDGAGTAVVGDGAWRWARKTSDADISPLVAVTVAGYALQSADVADLDFFFV